MLRILTIVTCVLFSAAVHAQDPVITDGDKYKIVLENERVRVLEDHDQPGEKTHQHRHPALVLYAISPFKRKLTLPDGKVLMRESKAGDVLYSDAQTHIGENIGETETHVIMVELKQETDGPAEKE
jgi:hypothetical protein